MVLMRWRPSTDLTTFQEEMNRLFEDFFQSPPSRQGLLEGAWNPTLDVSETDDDVVVRAELPGVTKDDVHVSITDNVLTIRGEKKQETEEKEKSYHRTECRYGTFQRSFSLPTAVEADKVKANFKDGVLKVEVPKAEEAKTREIAIDVE